MRTENLMKSELVHTTVLLGIQPSIHGMVTNPFFMTYLLCRWEDSIAAVKSQYPNVIFLAEVYSPWEQKLQVFTVLFFCDRLD